MPSYLLGFMNESSEKRYAGPLVPAVGHHSTGVERWTHGRSREEKRHSRLENSCPVTEAGAIDFEIEAINLVTQS
jgi:hypothetical protein